MAEWIFPLCAGIHVLDLADVGQHRSTSRVAGIAADGVRTATKATTRCAGLYFADRGAKTFDSKVTLVNSRLTSGREGGELAGGAGFATGFQCGGAEMP